MYQKISSKPLFQNTQTGLYQVFQQIASTNGTVTRELLAQYDDLNLSQKSFMQFLADGFSNYDTNDDGQISSEEINNTLSKMSTQGLTYEQLLAISSEGGALTLGTNKELLETVLTNFQQIDKNHDGCISETEISNYQIEKELYEKEKEFSDLKASDISVYYADSSSSSEESSSVLDYKYEDSSES